MYAGINQFGRVLIVTALTLTIASTAIAQELLFHFELDGNLQNSGSIAGSASFHSRRSDGAPTFVEGKFGQAIYFADRQRAALSFPFSLIPQSYPQLTLTAWVKQSAGATNSRTILSNGYARYGINGGRLAAKPGPRGISFDRRMDDELWVFVAVVIDSNAGTIRMHQGSSSMLETNVSISTSAPPTFKDPDNRDAEERAYLFVGANQFRNYGMSAREMAIDDVRLYAGALSEAEIGGLAAESEAPSEPVTGAPAAEETNSETIPESPDTAIPGDQPDEVAPDSAEPEPEPTATVPDEPSPAVVDEGNSDLIVEVRPPLSHFDAEFVFEGVPAGTAKLVDELYQANVAAGNYQTHLISSPADLVLTSVTCDDATSDEPSIGDVSSASAEFRVGAADTVTCAFDFDSAVGSSSTDSEEMPVPASEPQQPLVPPDLSNCDSPDLVPLTGIWNVSNHTGRVFCTGDAGVYDEPLEASEETGTLQVLNCGWTVIGTGLSEGTAQLEMTAVDQSGSRYTGSVVEDMDGVPMTIQFDWSLLSDSHIEGSLSAATNEEGMSCTITRSFELQFVGLE